MKPKDVLGLAKDRVAVMVDLKFMDFVGLWQHFTIPLAEDDQGWRRDLVEPLVRVVRRDGGGVVDVGERFRW